MPMLNPASMGYMSRDILFILPPGFFDHERREYCPESAECWGLLSWFPAIQRSLNVHYQPIEKPRPEMSALLGDKNQNCPTLALHADSPFFDNAGILQFRGQRFINNARDIGKYYQYRFGTPWPRGTY